MKKIIATLFILFILTGGGYAVMQSNIGRHWIQNAMTQALKEAGFDLRIDRLEGTLPHQIHLKGVSLQGNGIEAKAASLSFRPVLWRFFKKEFVLKKVDAKEISILNAAPFDFKGTLRINQNIIAMKGAISEWALSCRFDQKTSIARLSVRSPSLAAKGKLTFGPRFEFLHADFQITSDKWSALLPFPASGRLLGTLHIEKKEEEYIANGSWKIPNLVVERAKIGAIGGKGEAVWKDRNLKGTLGAGLFAKAFFDLTFRPNGMFTGSSALEIENLQSLHLPQVYGKLKAKAQWEEIEGKQGVHLDTAIDDFYYGSLYAQKLSAYTDLADLFGKPHGVIDIEAETLKWNHFELESAGFETTTQEQDWSFKLFAEGNWRHPFELHADGSWQNGFSINIDHLYGTFLQSPVVLQNPVRLVSSPDRFQLSKAEVAIGPSTAWLELHRENNHTSARLQCDALPLDFLSVNPLEVKVAGTLRVDAEIQESNNRLQGQLKAAVHQIEPFESDGTIEGTFQKDRLDLKGNFAVRGKPLLKADLSIPIRLSVWPFDAEILFHQNSKGQIAVDGRIEEFLDFLDLGPHRLEGACKADLKFSNTLYRPLLEGQIHFENGFYENYYSGTILTNIQSHFLAEKNIVYLQSFSATDQPGSGTVNAAGRMHLLKSDFYPFEIEANFDQFQFTQIDLVNAAAKGKIKLEGNALSAIAKGDIAIEECNLSIPDHIAQPIPNLQVVYRNPIHPMIAPENEHRPYPLHLDLNVIAPALVSISGRGLNSEWKGDFHIGGTYSALSAKGKLELINGEFNFSSRTFKLTDGSLSLSGIEHQLPYLNLAGSMETKGILITARLKGPLNNPQLTLQSSPPLPLGSIMSYLLFGQDISEIGGFQALQIATSLASLAGTGPDVMENTRRSLGVDRLRVITDPSEEGGETVALQVGKYVSKGVLVSFTQGTEDSSTNISVEIELKDNFVFQIESDQRQEQGKFTLKWNLNY